MKGPPDKSGKKKRRKAAESGKVRSKFDEFRASLGEEVSLKDAHRFWRWVQRRQHLFGSPPVTDTDAGTEPLDGDPPPMLPLRVAPWPRKRLPSPPSEITSAPGYRSFVELLAVDGLPAIVHESLKATYGFDDWRLSVLLVANARDGEIEKAELSAWLMRAVEELNADEFRAIAKCMDALKQGKQGTRSANARALALHFCRKHWDLTGRKPTQAWVRKFLVQHGFGELADRCFDMRKNEARDIFYGPVLGSLARARGGRPKTPSKVPKR